MALTRGKFGYRGGRGHSETDLIKFLGIGIVALAGLLGTAVFLHLSSDRGNAGVISDVPVEQVAGKSILVPVETLQVGASFQPMMFRTVVRPEEQVPGDVVTSFDELKGMYARGVLVKNQPVLKAALTNRQPVHVLTAMLPPQYRAVALQVQKPLLDNVDGWAQPGTEVDVVWITNVFGKETASVLAGPVKVLASNKAVEGRKSPEEGRESQAEGGLVTVTLLMTVRDAVRVSLAAMAGKISLGLRGAEDRQPNQAGQPISDVLAPKYVPSPPEQLISVKVRSDRAQPGQLRTYDSSGRRVKE